jgi:hypothetical protein
MSESDREEVHQRFSSDDEVDLAIKQAVREKLAQHGRLGQRVVIWLDDRPVWIIPDHPPTEDPRP